MATDAQRKARRKWNDKNMAEKYDRINLVAPKGQRAIITEAAQRAGESISQYMLKATQARMDAEKED